MSSLQNSCKWFQCSNLVWTSSKSQVISLFLQYLVFLKRKDKVLVSGRLLMRGRGEKKEFQVQKEHQRAETALLLLTCVHTMFQSNLFKKCKNRSNAFIKIQWKTYNLTKRLHKSFFNFLPITKICPSHPSQILTARQQTTKPKKENEHRRVILVIMSQVKSQVFVFRVQVESQVPKRGGGGIKGAALCHNLSVDFFVKVKDLISVPLPASLTESNSS